MLPFFFAHYDNLVDEYRVFDNGSTDRSLAILEAHPKVRLTHFKVPGSSFVEEERRLSDEIWKHSRGKADWVIVLDIDEHVFHPDLLGYLARCKADGVTAIRAIGYEMVSESFPTGDARLCEQITTGCRSVGHNKFCIFDPDAITESHFGPGRHQAWPEGNVVWPKSPEVLMLHYKQLGVDYVAARSAELFQGIKQGDIDQGWGLHYTWSREQIADTWQQMFDRSGPVPGLGELAHVPPSEYRGDEKKVEESGLLDPQWYLAAYEDVVANRADPADALTHFCLYGWKEGRMPNMYFEPEWYLATYPEVAESGVNPLIDYIESGEAAGAHPSPHFDPGWYRAHYGVPAEEMALRHYLRHRYTGQYSPVPGFDVESYTRRYPEVLALGKDPYEDYIERLATFGDNASTQPPTFSEVAAALGGDPSSEVLPATVSWAGVTKAIRLFLRTVPVDEAWYRSAYPDVDEAIAAGKIASARIHFIEHGFFEGRTAQPAADPATGPAS